MIQRVFSLLAFFSVLFSFWLQAPVQAAPFPARFHPGLMASTNLAVIRPRSRRVTVLETPLPQRLPEIAST
jgi:hypothetical protein